MNLFGCGLVFFSWLGFLWLGAGGGVCVGGHALCFICRRKLRFFIKWLAKHKTIELEYAQFFALRDMKEKRYVEILTVGRRSKHITGFKISWYSTSFLRSERCLWKRNINWTLLIRVGCSSKTHHSLYIK